MVDGVTVIKELLLPRLRNVAAIRYTVAAGKRDFVPALALAGLAAGAHGIIVESHYNPAEAQCDGPQALLPETFNDLMRQLRQIAAIVGKEFAEAGELAHA